MGLTYWVNITFDVEDQKELKKKVEEFFDNKLKRNEYVMNSFSFYGEIKWLNVEMFLKWFFSQEEVNNRNSIYIINENYDVELFHLKNWKLRLFDYLRNEGKNEYVESIQDFGGRYIEERELVTLSMKVYTELKKTKSDEEILAEITQAVANEMGEDYFRNPEWEQSYLSEGKQQEFYYNLGHA